MILKGVRFRPCSLIIVIIHYFLSVRVTDFTLYLLNGLILDVPSQPSLFVFKLGLAFFILCWHDRFSSLWPFGFSLVILDHISLHLKVACVLSFMPSR